ncbi:Myosin-8 [Hibiscus syriacus]|uniref:Myosin-8 n=1 Tax=Hibiscus syriacus TaxID=106335 RepID=A0A6A2XPD7_HIBSY|nr:Myosin-8 [Hibiscus syriacus]
MFPRSTHETFAQKLYQTFNNHKRSSKPKLSRSDFTICHYAGDATYQTELFLDKNKDYVVAEHQALLSASKCSFVSGLFPPLVEESSKSSKFSSIGSRFKPNNLLKPSIFENKNVLQQLRCGGVMEAIRISCAGYPTRKLFDESVDRFGLLAPEFWMEGCCLQKASRERLSGKCLMDIQAIGKPKVFLRAGQMAELDTRRTEILGRSSCIIQRKIRSYLARRSFIMLRLSALQIQSVSRGQLARKVYECMRRKAASLRIQRDLRMRLARKAYKELSSSAASIQTVFFNILLSMWKNMKGAARETGALQAAKNKLEKKVEELTWMLQLEKRMRVCKAGPMSFNAMIYSCWEKDQLHTEQQKVKQQQQPVQIELSPRQFDQHDQQTKLKKLPFSYERNRFAFEVAERQKKAAMAEEEEREREEKITPLKRVAPETLLPCAIARTCIGPALRVDVEEAKTQENAKLQSALQDLQLQFKETKELHAKERKAAKKAAEIVPIIQEVPVLDPVMLKKLTNENEKLKAMVSSLEKKIDETEKKFEETSKISEERLKRALDAESKVVQLKTVMQSLEEKSSDIESENQVLRQQTLLNSHVKKISQLPPIIVSPNLENGHHMYELNKSNEPQSVTPVKKVGAETDGKPRRSNLERQHENIDALINCVSKDIGFSQGKPTAAFTIYKCLLHWKSFEAERANVFDRLIQMIGVRV